MTSLLPPSECLDADVCVMDPDCPFVRDCRAVEAKEPENR